jgi:hypothetical protein
MELESGTILGDGKLVIQWTRAGRLVCGPREDAKIRSFWVRFGGDEETDIMTTAPTECTE